MKGVLDFITFKQFKSYVRIDAKGAWTSTNAGMLEAALSDATQQVAGKPLLKINLAKVTELDTFGAWLLERFRRDYVSNGTRVQFIDVPESGVALLHEVADVNLIPPKAVKVSIEKQLPAKLKAGFLELSSFMVMLGSVVSTAGAVVLRPFSFRITPFINRLDQVAWKALPIVILVTFIIGAIIAQQGFFHFRKFGADLYVIDMIGFLLMREIGVLLVAIVVAGRSGSSYTAELGSMKMREELDALKTMGYDPMEILILPRVLALLIAMPILTFIGTMAAFLGAGVVAVFYADLSPDLFLDRLNEAVTMNHFLVGMIKAPFIGAVIGVISCKEGLSVDGSASSLGRHTTQSVVKSIFMVIALDGIFTIFFSAIGI